MSQKKLTVSYCNHRIARCDMQMKNGQYSKASPDYVDRVGRAARHWERMRTNRLNVIARRRDKRKAA